MPLLRFLAASQDAVECREAAARKPEFQILNYHMPLADLGSASLAQLLDTEFATGSEISTLNIWTSAIDVCRKRLLEEIDSTVPAFGPIIEMARDSDDAVYVKLSQHELTWGQAILHLRSNRTKLRTELVSLADQIAVEFGNLQQEQLNRRATLLSSIIRILP